MKDLLEFLTLHWPELTAGFATTAALITTIVNVSKSSRLSKALEEAKSHGMQVRCPRCKKTSPLSEVTFVMPSGEIDNNLNGVPDNQE